MSSALRLPLAALVLAACLPGVAFARAGGG
ncbi:MAG: hypothetical protein RL199_938, partial [Pseudomonadota bacterium]